MADTKISALTTASTLDGTETILLSQSAADKKLTLSALREYSKWTRPASWLAMPTDVAQKVSILCAVYPDAGNIVGLNMTTSTGTYSVNWGDGVTDAAISSGVTATHTYDFADTDLDSSTVAEFGYKQAIIQITPNTGNFIAVNLGPGSVTNGQNGWLDILANIPNATSYSTHGNLACPDLERLRITGLSNTVTSFAVNGLTHLRVVEMPAGWAASMATTVNMFNTCRALRSVDMRGWGFGSSWTTATSMFDGCAALVEVQYDSGAFDSLTAVTSMFNGCQALPRLIISLPAATSLSNTFRNCGSLRRLEITNLGAVTTLADMCNSDFILREVVFPSASWAGSVATTTNVFNGCGMLSRVDNCYIPVSFTLPGRHASAQLDEVYTDLPAASATITVTGNYGTTGDTPSIALGKGWSVVGS